MVQTVANLFLRNIYDKYLQVKYLATYYKNFKKMLNCVVLLNKLYTLGIRQQYLRY